MRAKSLARDRLISAPPRMPVNAMPNASLAPPKPQKTQLQLSGQQ